MYISVHIDLEQNTPNLPGLTEEWHGGGETLPSVLKINILKGQIDFWYPKINKQIKYQVKV